MGEWKTIDTAPKDGTEIIGFDGEMVTCYSWLSSPDDDGHIGWCTSGYSDGGMLFHYHNVADPDPTHWMPLPDAPTNSKEG